MGDMFEVWLGAQPDGLDMICVDHGLQAADVRLCEKSQGDALSTHSCGSARAMGIGVGVGGKVVVDHVGCVRKIEAAAGQIRGDHDFDFHPAKAIEQRRSSGLVETTVDYFSGRELLLDMVVEPFSVVSGIAEYDGLFRPRLVHELEQGFEPILAADFQEAMLEALRRLLLLIQVDGQRISEIFPGQLPNLFRHCRRKQKCLVLVYEAANDEFDVRDEAHLEHFIRFVEDEGSDVCQAKRSVTKQVDEPSRSGHEDVNSMVELCYLYLDRKTTIDRRRRDVGFPGNLGDFSDVLQRQLAGRHEDQGLNGLEGCIDHLDKGNGAGGGFSGAGFCPGDDVGSGQDMWKRLFLNRRQIDVSHVS